jgi:proteasome alpha subunit
VAMQFYASPEQIMRDRSEFARKNIARGRNVVVMSYADGVLLVAETPSKTLHKVSEVYDRIGFAAVGRYNEFENLRAAGVRMADLRGYSYDRRDVTGRAIATAFAQTLGAIFTTETKPYEVEICIAEVGPSAASDELYRVTYDGQAQDEPGFLVLGGNTDTISGVVRSRHSLSISLADAVRLAVEALGSVGGENGKPRTLEATQLEVAVLDRARPGRKFRRLTGNALTPLLGSAKKAADETAKDTTKDTALADAGTKEGTADEPATASAKLPTTAGANPGSESADTAATTGDPVSRKPKPPSDADGADK